MGFPDDPTSVNIRDPEQFCICLESAFEAFRRLRDGPTLLSAEINSYHRSVWIRFVQGLPRHGSDGQMEPELKSSFGALNAEAKRNGGNLTYRGGNNYVDVSLPYSGPIRENFPEVEKLAWDDRYRHWLERASWPSLRSQVFRYANLAEPIAEYCFRFQKPSVLIPSVGICVHPWLFAHRGLSVIATDSADTALGAVSKPAEWPRLYSIAAYDRWGISQCASYASLANPEHFAEMPELQNQSVSQELESRITFVRADWAELPLEEKSVDAIFATNALPRESADERTAVLKEWVRLVRPGGIAFIVQHNFFESDIEIQLRQHGWVEVKLLKGEQPNGTGFQTYYSSG